MKINTNVAAVRPEERREARSNDNQSSDCTNGEEVKTVIHVVPTVGADLPETMSVDEAARFLGINRNTLYEDIAEGRFPAGRFGRRGIIRISRDTVIKCLLGTTASQYMGGGR